MCADDILVEEEEAAATQAIQEATDDERACAAIITAAQWVADHRCSQSVSFLGADTIDQSPWIHLRSAAAMRKLLPGADCEITRRVGQTSYRAIVDGIRFEAYDYSVQNIPPQTEKIVL